MNTLKKNICAGLAVGVCSMMALAADVESTIDKVEADELISNVQLGVPALADSELEVVVLQPTDIPGLKLGTFDARGIGKIQFLIAGDDRLYLLANDPIDLLSSDKLAQALSDRRSLRENGQDDRQSRLNAVADTIPTIGPADAPITIVGFVDYECPYCVKTHSELKNLLLAYEGQVRYAPIDFPRDGADNWSRKASVSALCAAQQDKAAYWALHEHYLKHQKQITPDHLQAQSRKHLSSSGIAIDLEQWETCLSDRSSEEYRQAARQINDAVVLGISLGVKGTPALYVNGRKFEGIPTVESLEMAIESIAKESPSGLPALEVALAERRVARANERAEQHAILNAALEIAPLRGNQRAPLTIVEFSDFQCPYCADAARAMKELLAEYGDQVRYAVLDFPLDDMHPWARRASIAAACGAVQSHTAYWTLHDFYFKNQTSLTADNLLPYSREQLAGHDIDLEQWAECAGNASSRGYLAAAARVQRASDLGKSLGVRGTPTFFINGEPLAGIPTASVLDALIADTQLETAP